MQPLAEQIRPTCLEEVVGQQHLLAPNRPLRRIIESGKIPNTMDLPALEKPQLPV